MRNMNDVNRYIEQFLASCPNDWEFPLGGVTEIPMSSEVALVDAIHRSETVQILTPGAIERQMPRKDAYALVTFAARMAVYSARHNKPHFLNAALLGIMIGGRNGNNDVDQRDLLVALAIIEDCATRMGANFRDVIQRFVHLASEQRRRTIEHGYLTRPDHARTIDVFGFVASGSGESLTYSSKTPIISREEILKQLRINSEQR